MNIVFVDPPSPPGFIAFRHSHAGFGECCRGSRLKFPTLDLFHAATAAIENGATVSVVDSVLMDHTPRRCVDEVMSRKPAWVVFRTSSGSCPHDLAVARGLRARFDGPIFFFGPQAAIEADTLLADSAVDAVVTGEPAIAFGEMARTRDWRGVKGVWHKRGDAVVKNPSAPLPQDLSFIPVPRWDLVDYRRYTYVTSQTSWGCPFGCGYCPYPVTQGKIWRTRPIASVVSEFLALRKLYGLRFVLLRDPEFTLRRDRTVELCQALIAAGTPLLWGCETRLETLDEKLIQLMARAGCIRVAFGVDSVHTPTLSAMGRKSASRRHLKAKVSALKRSGILTYGMYILGLPGETAESTRRLIAFAHELDTNAASFSMATPFPGTQLEKIGLKNRSIRKNDPLHLTSCVPSMSSGNMSMEQVEDFYRSAKDQWKRRKTKQNPSSASTLSARL